MYLWKAAVFVSSSGFCISGFVKHFGVGQLKVSCLDHAEGSLHSQWRDVDAVKDGVRMWRSVLGVFVIHADACFCKRL